MLAFNGNQIVGDLYISSAATDEIHKYNSQFARLSRVGSCGCCIEQGISGYTLPKLSNEGLKLGSAGSDRDHCFSPECPLSCQPGVFNFPSAMLADDKGSLWVVDANFR
jgi:hypothetical protein